jgi:rubrerythrin
MLRLLFERLPKEEAVHEQKLLAALQLLRGEKEALSRFFPSKALP